MFVIVLQRGSALVFDPLGTSGGSSNSEDSVSYTYNVALKFDQMHNFKCSIL